MTVFLTQLFVWHHVFEGYNHHPLTLHTVKMNVLYLIKQIVATDYKQYY